MYLPLLSQPYLSQTQRMQTMKRQAAWRWMAGFAWVYFSLSMYILVGLSLGGAGRSARTSLTSPLNYRGIAPPVTLSLLQASRVWRGIFSLSRTPGGLLAPLFRRYSRHRMVRVALGVHARRACSVPSPATLSERR